MHPYMVCIALSHWCCMYLSMFKRLSCKHALRYPVGGGRSAFFFAFAVAVLSARLVTLTCLALLTSVLAVQWQAGLSKRCQFSTSAHINLMLGLFVQAIAPLGAGNKGRYRRWTLGDVALCLLVLCYL